MAREQEVEAHVVAKNTIVVKALKGEKCVTVHYPSTELSASEAADEATEIAWRAWEHAFGTIHYDKMQALVTWMTIDVVVWLREIQD